MWLPMIRGIIDRRILVNYRVDPAVLAVILPPPFRPQVVRGFGVAGICLIRLREIRPSGCPRWLGLASENAAHRLAVEWDDGVRVRRGVYVLRRDTNSRLNALVGGRVFPGLHHYADFRVCEDDARLLVELHSSDGRLSAGVIGDTCDQWPGDSLFSSLEEASSFFRAGSLGYSPAKKAGRFEALELRCQSWEVQPMRIEQARSSWFDDRRRFPPGSVALDCALLMRGIEHEWRVGEDLCCKPAYAAAASRAASGASTTSA
jgi:hypothetical protein